MSRNSGLMIPLFSLRLSRSYLISIVFVYSGCIDYIFTNDNLRVLRYLEHPAQNELSHHVVNVDAMRDNEQSAGMDEEQMKLEKAKEIENGRSFPYLPDENYPSDHMALVADLEFMPTVRETKDILDGIKAKKVM